MNKTTYFTMLRLTPALLCSGASDSGWWRCVLHCLT